MDTSRIFKAVELAFLIACLVLHFHDPDPVTETEVQILISATFGGYLIILSGIFFGLFTGQPISRKIDMFFNLVGCTLFLSSGSLIIGYYKDHGAFMDKETKDFGLAKGSLSIINGVVLFLDFILHCNM